MNVIYPDSALIWLLQQIASTDPGLVYHLYVNEVNWSPQTSLADLTAADTVFPPQTVAIDDWIISGVQDNVGYLQAANLLFTNYTGANQTVFGYFATDGTGGVLVLGAQFDGAPLTVQPNANVALTPILGGYSANVSDS